MHRPRRVFHPDHRVSDDQPAAGPRPFVQAADSANRDVRPKTPPVASKGGDCAVGGHQQGENVEAVEAVVENQSRIRPGDLRHVGQHAGMRPRGEDATPGSRTWTIRSLGIPDSVSLALRNCSPAMDFTGYRQISDTCIAGLR